jgi:DNA excision repair protein ERCC-5
MGVTGLWPILSPTARPTPLPTLNRKRLAVDASIWIYQFLKAVRDKEGNALRNSHVVGFFRRICKLLYFGIKPVFVFDGGAPALKRQTILGRKNRREGRREDAVRTAGRLLAVQMKKRSEEEEEKRKRDKERGRERVAEEEEVLPAENEMVYVGELGMSAQERTATRKFTKKDAYHLPELSNSIEGMGQLNDPRIMSAEELEDYARQFHNGEDVNMYDFSKIDFSGEFFMSLPAGDRYNILNAARLRSRLRMGLSKEQLEHMFPDRMAFSRFQIERVRERNELTQRLMNLNGMNDKDAMYGVGGGRIAGEKGREYILVKNDGVEGGWALGVVSTERGVGGREKPIDVDALHQKANEDQATEDSEEEFEDVPVEGLNRLPRLKDSRHNLTYEDFREREIAEQRQKTHSATINKSSGASKTPAEELNSLFVDDDWTSNNDNDLIVENEEEELNRAIALSLQKEPEVNTETDEEEHLNRAIALSLQKNHHLQESESDGDADFEDVLPPQYEQRAVAAPKPITTSSGKMVAHIVNNRATASVPKRRVVDVGSDSDSELDLQSALAKARKEKAHERRKPAPAAPNLKNPFDGPLPFEKLQFKKSLFGKKDTTKQVSDEDAEDDLAGGFEIQPEKKAPKPLPPWMTGSYDIRDQVQEQRKFDLELGEEDRERALEEHRAFRKANAPIEIESSDDDGDVQILDKPPTPKVPTETMGHLTGDVSVQPSISDRSQGGNSSSELLLDNPVEHETAETYESDEQVDWSESEHGDTATLQETGLGRSGEEPVKSPRKSPEFEDVEIPQPPSTGLEAKNENTTVSVSEQQLGRLDQSPKRDAFRPQDGFLQDIDDAEFDDLSDPEDEELLAQLAVEAEEHARFASTLNNKSAQENQDSYERELKALRNQQKKDRRDADEVSHIMITECQALLRLFGLPYITAPMEAEAQCAELVRLGLVDGIVTDDSDIFLFGGTRVYKNMFNSNKFVECYLSSDLEKELSLSRDQLISIAHLLGSDYTEGLPGVGPVTALEILSEFPSQSGLEEFRDWWASTQLSKQPLTSETSTFRKKFRRSQSTKLFLPPGFPSPAVSEAYLKPAVDSTPEPFQWGVPDLDRLRDFLMATIGWTQERTDEVLVPVIRDMNRRETEGTQSNITKFFTGAVGVGANTETSKGKNAGSKRMRDAVGKLKAKKTGLGGTFGEQAAEWSRKNEWRERGKGKGRTKNSMKDGRGKGKKRSRVEIDDSGDEETVAAEDEADNESDGDDDSAESNTEQVSGPPSTKGKAKGKGEARAKRTRTEV